ncbi:TonB-dependent receptor [Niabella terrae]
MRFGNLPLPVFLKFLLISVSLSATLVVSGQGAATGRLQNSETGEPLYMATVTLFKAADTSMVNYRLSGQDGRFRIPGIEAGIAYRLIVSYAGYSVIRKSFTLSADSLQYDFGTLTLRPDTNSLDEVLVLAERPPMIVRNDTVEFNASSFKTLPNALVEDLLKKLPGVQVDRQGNIRVNGKRVNRIQVDGKNFFGSDPKMASRNLPSNVIDKIQVTDDKEEMLERGEDNLNNVGKVINLSFKKGVKKGLFGKAYAGGGSGANDGRFEAGAIANIFRDTLQLSLLGYSNNLNRPGFSRTDLMQTGGMERSREVTGEGNNNTSSGNFGSSMTLNGINFGGLSQLGGVTTSSGLGINLNHAPNDKKAFFAQYYFGRVHTDVRTDNRTEIFNADTVITNKSIKNTLLKGGTHTFGAGVNLKPDTLTSIKAYANYIIADQDDNSHNFQEGFNNLTGPLNTGNVQINTGTGNHILRENFSLVKRSKAKPGRQFTFTQGLAWNKKQTDAFTDASISYYYPQLLDSIMRQLRQETVPNWYLFTGAGYREPLSKIFFLRTGMRYEFERLENSVATFDRSQNTGDLQDADLSRSFKRNSSRYLTNAGIELKIHGLSITPGLKYQYLRFENLLSDHPNPVKQEFNKLLPYLELNYKKLSVTYSRDLLLPDYAYMNPVINNTDPYAIRMGNTNLLPSTRDRIYVSLNTFNPKNNLNVWSWFDAWTADNDVVYNIQMDEAGVQTLTPVNVPKSKRIATNFGLNQDIKYQNQFTFSWNFGTWSEYREIPFLYNENQSTQKRLFSNVWGFLGFNWDDKLELIPSYALSYINVSNTNPLFASNSSFEQTLALEGVLRKIKHVIFETDIRYINNNAFTDPAYKRMIMWNAGVNFTFFPDERAVLRLFANDILKQTRNTEIVPNQNTLQTNYSNVLGRYFMATFTYNLRPSGAKSKVGGWSLW